MNKVLIMLSTYNGEKYLREQLDSLYAQKDVDIHILVRDDGSEDSTIEILKEYQQKYGKMTILEEENVGAARSFYALLVYAKQLLEKFDYYAFSDQDDVWKANKLSYSIEQLESSVANYQLFYSNVIVSNALLEPMKLRGAIAPNILQCNIIGNKQLGCTQVFNYALFEKIVYGIKNSNVIMGNYNYYPLHDAWTSLVGYSYDANIVYGDVPTMYYRQHSTNVVGDKSLSFIEVCRDRMRRLFKRPNTKSLKCKYILSAYEDLPKKSFAILKLCADYRENGLKGRSSLAFNKLFHKQGFINNIGFIVSVLTGKF